MEHITINSDRSVTVPVELRKIGVQYDHNVNTIEFVGPRYSSNVDLSTMTIYINYILSDKTPGKYKAENVIIDDQDDSLIRFNWTITRNVTKVSGILSCLVCAKKTDEEGNEINHWNTDIFRLLSVSEGMENDLVIQEQYPDIITSLIQNVNEHDAKLLEFSGLDTRVTDIENNVNELKEDLDNITDNANIDLFVSWSIINNKSLEPNGDIISNIGFWVSDYIDIDKKDVMFNFTNIPSDGIIRIGLYDESKSWIVRDVVRDVSSIYKYRNNHNAEFMRISCKSESEVGLSIYPISVIDIYSRTKLETLSQLEYLMYGDKYVFVGDENGNFPLEVELGDIITVTNNGTNNASVRLRNEGGTAVQLLEILNPNQSETVTVTSSDVYSIGGYCEGGYKITVIVHNPNSVEDRLSNFYIQPAHPNIIYKSREGIVTGQVPPNSKYAIMECTNNQYDRVRFTCRKSTDGYYFLCHDDLINNEARNNDGSTITQEIYANDCTLSQLNQYDWGIKYGEQYQGMNVPTLENALYYSHLFNIGVDVEFSFTPSQDDINAIHSLLCKYGVIDNFGMHLWSDIALMKMWADKDDRINFYVSSTVANLDSMLIQVETNLKSEHNTIYFGLAPFGTDMTYEASTKICAHGFKPYYTALTMASAEENIDKGLGCIELKDVKMVKLTMNKYASSLLG